MTQLFTLTTTHKFRLQCAGAAVCHYGFNGIYGCASQYPPPPSGLYSSAGAGSILGVRTCGTPTLGYSTAAHMGGDFAMYSQHTLPGSRFNTVKRAGGGVMLTGGEGAAMPLNPDQGGRTGSASPRLSAEF